jgi:hypothetical protein
MLSPQNVDDSMVNLRGNSRELGHGVTLRNMTV